MISKSKCFITSLVSIVLSGMCMVWWNFNFDLPYSSPIPAIWMILFSAVFPIILYCVYFNSNLNKLVAFILAFLTSVICFCIYNFTYHFRTDFKYWKDDETLLLFTFLVTVGLVITLISATIYFMTWWKQRK